MESLEAKRTEFRRYLEQSGVVDALSKSLTKVYELPNKPMNAVNLVRKFMCEECPDEGDFEKLNEKLKEMQAQMLKLQKEIYFLKERLVRTDSEIEIALKAGFAKIEENTEWDSLLKKYLNDDLLESLKPLKTELGSTLLDCVQAGIDNLHGNVGLYAPDGEAYKIFNDLFEPIIIDYHAVTENVQKIQPELFWGNVDILQDLDPNEDFIISLKIQCSRNLEKYPFLPKMTKPQMVECMNDTKEVIGDDFTFYSLDEVNEDLQKELQEDGILFHNSSKCLQSINCYRYWPAGRAVLYNENKTLTIWCNAEDHIQIISRDRSGKIGAIYKRVTDQCDRLKEQLNFTVDNTYGHLTVDPRNIGTALKITLVIKLPSTDRKALDAIGIENEFEIIEINAVERIFEISNRRKFGITEYEIISKFIDVIIELIKIESSA